MNGKNISNLLPPKCFFVFGLFLSLGMVSFHLSSAAENQFLADRHMTKGVNCDACHKENPPQASVPMEICLQCHGGSYEAVADNTKKMDPNPHASHRGDLPCESCHHGHKPSVDRCGTCHDFGFKVP